MFLERSICKQPDRQAEPGSHSSADTMLSGDSAVPVSAN